MYESHFCFRKKPFSILPDADFLHLTPQHELALAALRYGLDSRALMTVITGDIGCGKTTLLRKLIGEITDDINVGLITNTHKEFGDPIQLALQSFDLKYSGKSRVEQHQGLVEYIIREYAEGRHTVLIIDEAQNLDDRALEQVRMLSNINVDHHCILQLVLVGQPELRQALRQPKLLQFAQRVSSDYHILPLAENEVGGYIQHRLKVVGGNPDIFLPETYPAIHAQSEGVPRLINILCDTALVYAYGAQSNLVNLSIIQEVIADREEGIYVDNFHSNLADNAKSVDSTDSPATVRGRSDELQETAIADIASDSDDYGDRQLGDNERGLATKPLQQTPEPALNTMLETARLIAAQIPEDSIAHREAIQAADQGAGQDAGQDSETVIDKTVDEIKVTEVTPSESVPALAQDKIDHEPRQTKDGPDDKTDDSGDESIAFSIPVTPVLRKTAPKPRRTWLKVALWLLIVPLSYTAYYLYQNPQALRTLSGLIQQSQQQPQQQPTEVQRWLAEADEYLKAEKLLEPVGENAFETYARVLDREPENSEALAGVDQIKEELFSRATQAQKQSDWDASRRLLQSLLKIDPDNAKGKSAIEALSALQAAAQPEAIASEQVKLKADTKAKDEKKVNADASEKVAEKSSEKSSEKSGAEEASLLAESSVPIRALLDEAEDFFEAGQLLAPQDKNAYANYSKVLQNEVDNAEALAGIKMIMNQLYGDAMTSESRGDWAQAQRQLKSMLQINPQSKRGREAMNALAKMRAAAKAQAATQSQIQSWLSEADAYLKVGQLVTPEGANAYALLRKVLERDSNNITAQIASDRIKDTLFSMAASAITKGDNDLARRRLQSLLQIDPLNARGQEALSVLLNNTVVEGAPLQSKKPSSASKTVIDQRLIEFLRRSGRE